MKNKKIVVFIGCAVLLTGVFAGTYALRTSQLNKEVSGSDMNKEYVEELDSYKVNEFKITLGDKEYTSLEELEGTEAGTVVKCELVLESGDTVNVDGYIENGDESHIEYNGVVAKVTVKGGN